MLESYAKNQVLVSKLAASLIASNPLKSQITPLLFPYGWIVNIVCYSLAIAYHPGAP